jgi:hypothetical protein
MIKQLERGKNRNRNRVEITDKFTNPTKYIMLSIDRTAFVEK